MAKYATGKFAMGICARSGRKMPLRAMVPDPNRPGLMVDPAWADRKHPIEENIVLEDGVALRRPAPDVDDDSPGDDGQTIAQALGFDGVSYFGSGE